MKNAISAAETIIAMKCFKHHCGIVWVLGGQGTIEDVALLEHKRVEGCWCRAT